MQHRDGELGTVAAAQALYATIEWNDGRREEVDQFEPSVEVILRAEPA